MKIMVHFFWILFIALTILSSFRIASGDVSNLNIRKKPIILDTDSSFLIDDFSKAEGVSSIGTQWRMFTDRVMGGESTANSGYEVIDGRRCLRLKGSVSLENNGGFVQVALPLDLDGRFFDAGEFVQRIKLLLKSPELAQQMGQSAFERVSTMFNLKENIKKIEGLYESLMENIKIA